MNLRLLRQISCLSIYHDLTNDWLYLDWQGELTLPQVQQACLELAACYLERPYARVLNSNEQVTGVSWSVAAWLVSDFLPYMALAGIEHVAWVYSSSLRGYNMAATVLHWLPGSLITSFDTVAEAATWLAHTRTGQPQSYLIPQRTPATQAKLVQEVAALRQRIAAQQLRRHAA
ncbi:hypothetical protein [Hymenobacter sp. BT559]|uniref:hypothetical protein n=1 Tax=Hymenobacter sp. BT559 TaxID=2795729 RepID=UPI0018EDD928|nr:hypothetical protein [Hymenobacter sp. BT559]MBJ6145327.1 hypothetical protein [Hymenobacter sp. BT559]